MSHSFNLLTQPWIPCVDQNGNRRNYGLRDALVQAHEIREIYADSPLTMAALYRLLLAVLHRCFGPADRFAWARLWEQQHWDSAVLDDYFAHPRISGRFDLFDAEHPFYQVRTFHADKEPEAHPISVLALQEASGNNTTLFDHHLQDLPQSLAVDDAARRLITAQTYALGFGVSHTLHGEKVQRLDSPSVRGAVFFTLGENLFQTLLLSMRYYPRVNSRLPDGPNDKPAWELEDPYEPRDSPYGYLDYLTWQSRQIRLGPPKVMPDGTLLLETVQLIQGLRAKKETVLDPLRSYRTDDKGKLYLRGFSPERVLWRDSTALLELAETAKHDAPENFHVLADALHYSRVLARHNLYRYVAIGLKEQEGQAAGVNFWRAEYMPLPLAYLDSQDTVSILREAIQCAERVEQALSDAVDWLVWLWLYPTEERTVEQWHDSVDYKLRYDEKKGDKKFQTLRRQLNVSQGYWWRLANPFREAVVGLVAADQAQYDMARTEWYKQLQATAREAFREMMTVRSESGRMFRAVAEAQKLLEREMGRALQSALSNEIGLQEDSSNEKKGN